MHIPYCTLRKLYRKTQRNLEKSEEIFESEIFLVYFFVGELLGIVNAGIFELHRKGEDGMAFDTLDAVFQAEQEAKKILEEAKEDARELAVKARQHEKEKSQEILAKAKEEASKIRSQAAEEAKSRVRPVLDQAKAQVEAWQHVDATKKAQAVKYVVNEVIEYGNC